jgi:hypothetical protein
MNNESDTSRAPQPTVKEVLDNNIALARRHVEELCIKKAKLETLNMLDMPYFQVADLFNMR